MTRRLVGGVFVLVCVAAFGFGGAALAGAFDDRGGGQVSGEDAARAGSAAVRAAGGGEILSVERTDDGGAAWDVDVLRDGRELEVSLDERLRSARMERDRVEVVPPARLRDDDDGPLTAEQVRRAGQAAVRVAGGGSVESAGRSDDLGESYEIEVVRAGREIDVALDARFRPMARARADED